MFDLTTNTDAPITSSNPDIQRLLDALRDPSSVSSRDALHGLCNIIESGVTDYWLGQFATADARMIELKDMTRDLAVQSLDDPVLITGPTGTGKELLARALHGLRGTLDHMSKPDMSKFVAFNCAAISPSLLESELFGHIKGSFTDAKTDNSGLLASVNNGTIFLDEIGEMPLDAQAKLLRAVQEREVRPVGSSRTVPITSRFIAATKYNLEDRVSKQLFRDDLFARLMTFELHTTGLVERPDDIPVILQHLRCPIHEVPESYLPTIHKFNVRALQTFKRRLEVWGRSAVGLSSNNIS